MNLAPPIWLLSFFLSRDRLETSFRVTWDCIMTYHKHKVSIHDGTGLRQRRKIDVTEMGSERCISHERRHVTLPIRLRLRALEQNR
jgi:hypothetical protein